MYSQRLMNLDTPIKEEKIYSDRLLNLESEMENQQSSSEIENVSNAGTSNRSMEANGGLNKLHEEQTAPAAAAVIDREVKPEPLASDELIEGEEQTTQVPDAVMERQVKPEPLANNEGDDPSFFDNLLPRSEEERRNEDRREQQTPVAHLKREPANNDANCDTNDPNFFDGLFPEEERRERQAPVVNLKRERTHKDASAAPKGKKSKTNEPRNEVSQPRLQVRTDLSLFSKTPKPIGESLLFMNAAVPGEVHAVEVEEKMTAQEKMSKALERILYARRAFERERSQKEKKFYAKNPVFVYTQTVRKLPSSSTHYTQQIYDNRSPLHTVNNVSFAFNSTTTRLNLHDWGIEAPPPSALKVARALGYDAETLYLKRSSIKIPDKIQKNKNIKDDTNALFEQSGSTLFINATVQTEEVRILPIRRADMYRNVGIQHNPQTISDSTQTSSAYCGNSVADLPLMRLIQNLNENQLQAVDDFVQLIMEPTGFAGVDIYAKRSQLNEIYNMSQRPSLSSSLMPHVPSPPSLRGYNSDDYDRPEIKREANRDPRLNQQRGRPTPYQGGHFDPDSDRSSRNSSSTKYYGRGGHRR